MLIRFAVFLLAFFYLGIMSVVAESAEPSASVLASPQVSPSAVAQASDPLGASPSAVASESIEPSMLSSPVASDLATLASTKKPSMSPSPSVTVVAQVTQRASPTPSPSPSVLQASLSPLASLDARGSFLPIELGNSGGNAMDGNVLAAKDVVADKPTNLLTHVIVVVLFGVLLVAGMFLAGKRPAFVQSFLQRSEAEEKKSVVGKMRNMNNLC